MRNKVSTVLVSLLLIIPIGVTQKAHAAELKALGFTLSWDENSFYLPTGKCVTYIFSYRSEKTVTTMFTIQNQYNEIIGAEGVLSGDVSGQKSMMICKGPSDIDFTGTKVVLDVRSLSSNEIVSAPIVFKVRETTKNKKKDKTIVCKKGKESLNVTGKTPKCPSGYKLQR